jgi:hypothetical protein
MGYVVEGRAGQAHRQQAKITRRRKATSLALILLYLYAMCALVRAFSVRGAAVSGWRARNGAEVFGCYPSHRQSMAGVGVRVGLRGSSIIAAKSCDERVVSLQTLSAVGKGVAARSS